MKQSCSLLFLSLGTTGRTFKYSLGKTFFPLDPKHTTITGETSPLHSLTRIVNRNHLRIQIAPLGHSTGDQRKKQAPISRGLVERSPFITECV
jgi:hypothetical protein